MWTEITRIIHLTDMHLHVDRNGRMRSPQDRAKAVRAILGLARQFPTGNLALVKGIQGLAKGLKSHSHRALQALFKTLDLLAKAPHPGRLLIIQSGDLEAYGALQTSFSTWFSPAFEYWTTEVARFSQADESVNIYGNHDVWPGTLPLFDPQSTGDVEQYLQSIYFPGALPNPLVMNASPCTLEIYRLNTVQAHCLKNTLASGNIDTNILLPPTHSPFAGQSTVRLLVMHHPPHFFNASGGISDLFEGRLTNATDLLQPLSRRRFHLIMAGHRHALNPAPGTTLKPTPAGRSQPPLPHDTIQLVAGSPTQETDPGDPPPSFSLYSLETDEMGTQLRVSRMVYRFEGDLDQTFTPDPLEVLVDGLSIA